MSDCTRSDVPLIAARVSCGISLLPSAKKVTSNVPSPYGRSEWRASSPVDVGVVISSVSLQPVAKSSVKRVSTKNPDHVYLWII